MNKHEQRAVAYLRYAHAEQSLPTKDRPAFRKILRSPNLDIIVVEATERLGRDRFEWPDIGEFEQ